MQNFLTLVQWFAGADKTLSTPIRLLCGGMAGMASVLASYPLDVVRCRLSAQQIENKLYYGIWDCLQKIAKQEGFLALYRGLLPTLYGIAPYVALNFTFFEKLKAFAIDYSGSDNLSVHSKLLLAGIGGTAAQTSMWFVARFFC